MTGSVTVYFNTGFNGVDIPASPSVLASASKKTYSDVYYMREDIDKPSIRIKDSYENLCAVDYCSITTSRGTSYYFASPSSLSRGVTVLALDLDALLTMGGASNLNYISGWQERGHIKKSDDVLFDNLAPEDWKPSQALEATSMQGLNISGTANADINILVSNIALESLGNTDLTQEVIEGITNGELDPVMYFPKITTTTNPTGFYIYDFQESQEHNFTLPNTAAYNPDAANIQKGLNKLYSCGQLQLQSSYQIPKEYVSANYGVVAGRYTNLHGIHGEEQLSGIPFEYAISGYTPKNKKVFSTFRSYVVVNLGSGDMSIKEPAEIYDGNAAPSIILWTDPCSTGKPYARFKYIKGNPLQYADCVRGLQWANNQIVMEGASGAVWNSMQTAFANRQLQTQKEYSNFTRQIGMKQVELALASNKFNAFTSMVGAGGGDSYIGLEGAKDPTRELKQGKAGQITFSLNPLASAVAAAGNMELNKYDIYYQEQLNKASYALEQRQLDQSINQNNVGLIQSNNVVAPSVSFSPEQNLGLYGYNKFVFYEVRKTDADLKSEDMYYQRYGYNGLHRPLTQQCFKEREYYSYVQAFDVNLKGAQEFGMRVRSKAISQLNAGVRVWKVLPDASYYELN